MAKKSAKTDYLFDSMQKLPEGIIKHSERCKELAKVIIKQVECDEWFLKEIDKPADLEDAIYFHDIGKLKIKNEYLYKNLCLNPNDLHRYYEHINQGLKILEHPEVKKSDKKYLKYLPDVIKYHHLRDSKKSVAGVIAFMADYLENKCYEVKLSNSEELTSDKFASIYVDMITELEKASVAKRIIKAISDEDYLVRFFNFIDKFYNEHDDGMHCGINVKGYNIYDIFQTNEIVSEGVTIPVEDHIVFGKRLTYSIVNRYYGEVHHKDFIYFAMKHKKSIKLDNFFIDNVNYVFKERIFNKEEYLFMDMCITSFSKNIIKKVTKILVQNDFQPDRVVFNFDLFTSDLAPLYVENLEILKKSGYKISISNIGTNHIEILKQIKFDYAFYENLETNSVDTMFAELVQSLGTTMILTKKNIGQYRYVCGEEKNVIDLVPVKDGEADGSN